MTINATAYAQSIVGNSYGNSGSIAYNINRGCKRFEGRVGLSDSSALTATGITILGDTTGLYANSFGLTQSAAVGLDLTGVFRITVDWTSTNTAGTPGEPVGRDHRPRVSSFALQLLASRRTVNPCDD